jgi:DNA-binding SARP family transcriptional activator
VLEIRVLGPLEVVRDGRPVALSGQRQRAVLTLLVLHANRVVPVEVLLDRLWGEHPPPNATPSLHNAISQLRKLLGAQVVETRAPGYVLHVDPSALDVARFEQRLHEAGAAVLERRGELLREALGEWRGPALAEVAYEPWAEDEARRLEELRITALEERLEADLETGGNVELVAELEALVASNPLRERLWGQLMLALYRAGRQGEASQAYQRARHALVAELGIEPGPALKELHGSIIRQEVEPAGSGGSRRVPPGDCLGDVVAALLAGRVVPVFGEESDRLATRLAERFHYPRGEPSEIPRVSQYAAATRGYGPLYDELGDLFREGGEPNLVHEFFASLPPILRAYGVPQQLLVTTAYDARLERAFAAAGHEVDVVAYIASGRDRGKFGHLSPDGSFKVISVPNTYATELSLERRPVILKIRGQADPGDDRTRDSFVVTEDDYIEFLARADVAAGVPVALAATLRRSHFLFLGYTVRDWNLRLVLGRIWGDEPVVYRSWAVSPTPRPAERELWRRLDVDLVETPVELFIEGLSAAVCVPAEISS